MIVATRIEEHGNIKLRIWMVLILAVFAFAAIIGRLFEKQIIQYDHYQSLAYNQRFREEKIRPARGNIYVTDIYSDTKYPLVANKTFWALMVVPNQIDDPVELANILGPIIEISPAEISEKLSQSTVYIPPIKHKLTDAQRETIESLNLPGVTMLPEVYRDYPEGTMGSKFLGFVDSNGEGQYGVEGYLNDILKGEDGKLIAERDVLGRQITVANNKMIVPKNGQDVVLTIDRVIQFFAEENIKKSVEAHQADSGSVVVMNPKTGEILALAEYPTYDPAVYNEVKPEDYEIFKTMAVSDPYESGSVFKPLSMASGIDTGAVKKDDGEYFEANVQVDDYVIWNSERKAHGYETMTQVLENSDNVGMVWMIKKLGKDKFYEYLDRFRFNKMTGVEISGEEVGFMQPKKYVPDVGVATMSFGQGITVTEMQLVQAMGAIANDGLIVQPHIVKAYIDKKGNKTDIKTNILGRALSETTAKQIKEMLVSVVERGHGKQAKVKGYYIGGKTGTAQIPLKDRRGYEADKFTGSFLGLGPTDDPQFVMIVRINVPKDVIWAESTAAPVFGEMARDIINYYQLPPDQFWADEQTKREKGLID
ncbi:penicillin-binding protein 2 [Candidatus Microgenomates bacterium]|nr:penicillin-binding protein 2 [Candidatus Microgenomates bacterium]